MIQESPDLQNINEQKRQLELQLSEQMSLPKTLSTGETYNVGIDIQKCLLKYKKYEVYRLQYKEKDEVKYLDTYMFVHFGIKQIFMVELAGNDLIPAFKEVINRKLNRI